VAKHFFEGLNVSPTNQAQPKNLNNRRGLIRDTNLLEVTKHFYGGSRSMPITNFADQVKSFLRAASAVMDP
jgi:hypothetical protein